MTDVPLTVVTPKVGPHDVTAEVTPVASAEKYVWTVSFEVETPGPGPHDFGGLASGREYTIGVRAINAEGQDMGVYGEGKATTVH